MSSPSRCNYCGSTNFGKGCRFAPFGVHLHVYNRGRCVYCNSSSYGKGCRLNPTSDLHIHGIQFNTMFREQMKHNIQNNILVEHLQKPFTEFPAYDLGLINEHGQKLRSPKTEEEHVAMSPYVETLLHLKHFLGHKAELLQATSDLRATSLTCEKVKDHSEDMRKAKQFEEYKQRINEAINQIYATVEEAHQTGFAYEDLQTLIST